MKKGMLLFTALILLTNSSLAIQTSRPSKVTNINFVLAGSIVDNLCIGAHKTNLAEFIKTHTKICALMPNCQSSGYSLYTQDGKLLAFSKASSPKIVKFLKGKTNTLSVEVTVKKKGTTMDLVTIKNQK